MEGEEGVGENLVELRVDIYHFDLSFSFVGFLKVGYNATQIISNILIDHNKFKEELMPRTNKEKERSALHATIWRIANDLRGSIDGWDFKQYVLGILFYRFISENLTNYINEKEKEASGLNFNYAQLTDKDAECVRTLMLEEKGFFIYPSELFENVCKASSNDHNLNETLENIFKNIESSAQGTDSESDMRGLFDDLDVNSNKLGAT